MTLGPERELSRDGLLLHVDVMRAVQGAVADELSDGEVLAAVLMAAGVFIEGRNRAVPPAARVTARDMAEAIVENVARGEAMAARIGGRTSP